MQDQAPNVVLKGQLLQVLEDHQGIAPVHLVRHPTNRRLLVVDLQTEDFQLFFKTSKLLHLLGQFSLVSGQ
jgi:hypothetical protein